MSLITLSRHARRRSLTRFGINSDTLTELAEKVLKTPCRLPGYLLRSLPRVNTYTGGGHSKCKKPI